MRGSQSSGSGGYHGDSRRIQQHQGQQRRAGGYRYGPNPAYRPPSTSRHRQSWVTDTDEPAYQRCGQGTNETLHVDYARGKVFNALTEAGLEYLNLIVGIDFTESNERTGGRSLHHISSLPNPYEQVMLNMKDTLSRFYEDNHIPCFGFGDDSTRDQDVFCFYPNERPCNGLSEALNRYRELTPHLYLAGPASLAPIIEMAMTIVERSGRLFHVLLIIANGQVMRSVDTAPGQLSSQEQKTIDAIVMASGLPLSIVFVGVGDGPWDMMKGFVDQIPTRAFDNFHFVNFTDIMSNNLAQSTEEAEFVLSVMMEIPQQYEAIMELGLLGCGSRTALPPPPTATGDNTVRGFHNLPQSREDAALMEPWQNGASAEYDAYSDESDGTRVCLECGSTQGNSSQVAYYPPESSTSAHEVCPICITNPKNMVFGCGHQVCCDCSGLLEICPICRVPVTTRIKLYN